MDQSGSIEILHIPARDVSALVPKSTTWGFYPPRWQTSGIRRWTECHTRTWCWMSNEPWATRRDLESFPLPGVPLSCIVIRYLWEERGKRDNARSISRQEHDKFILIRALWRVTTLHLSFFVNIWFLDNYFDAFDRLWSTTFIVCRTAS
jgi:hypothetical protein